MINTVLTKLKLIKIKLFKKEVAIGKNARIDFNTVIDTRKNIITIGDNVYLRSNPKGYHAAMPFPTTILIDVIGAKVEIGNNTRVNGVFIHAKKSIIIGKNCVIASGVQILDSNGHELISTDRTASIDLPEEIIIEDNVWIGLNSIILKGTRIGANSVISAGCIVKGIIPPNSLVKRNSQQIIELNFKNEISNTSQKRFF